MAPRFPSSIIFLPIQRPRTLCFKLTICRETSYFRSSGQLKNRGFHASRCMRAIADDFATKTHYERLSVPTNASAATIKKSFYALSKTHHPDANPSDPTAASRFSLLSESYTILSHPSRRATYDRDTLRLHHGTSGKQGSYSSTHNPAGGRPASGLSRRKGSFRGPPPSFYRSGGWGDQAEKRRRAHESSTGSAGGHTGAEDPAHTASSSFGGMGPGSNPFHDAEYARSTPHFDKEGHTKTHEEEDRRRWKRQRRAMDDDGVEFEPQTSLGGHFLIVAGILGATILAPMVYLQFLRLGRQKKDYEP